MMRKLLTFEELEKLEFEDVSEISIGNTEYSGAKVHVSDERIIVDDQAEEKYFVYDSVGRNTFYYTVEYEFEEDNEDGEDSEDDEADEKTYEIIDGTTDSIKTDDSEKPKSFWGIKL